ncbi:MAG TPA: hypothetical protein PKM88_02165 [bacterium]|nr:hypothetical protein [bacterium]
MSIDSIVLGMIAGVALLLTAVVIWRDSTMNRWLRWALLTGVGLLLVIGIIVVRGPRIVGHKSGCPVAPLAPLRQQMLADTDASAAASGASAVACE